MPRRRLKILLVTKLILSLAGLLSCEGAPQDSSPYVYQENSCIYQSPNHWACNIKQKQCLISVENITMGVSCED